MEVLEVYELRPDHSRGCEVVYSFKGTDKNYAGLDSIQSAMEAIAILRQGLGWGDIQPTVIGSLLRTYTPQSHPELFV